MAKWETISEGLVVSQSIGAANITERTEMLSTHFGPLYRTIVVQGQGANAQVVGVALAVAVAPPGAGVEPAWTPANDLTRKG